MTDRQMQLKLCLLIYRTCKTQLLFIVLPFFKIQQVGSLFLFIVEVHESFLKKSVGRMVPSSQSVQSAFTINWIVHRGWQLDCHNLKNRVLCDEHHVLVLGPSRSCSIYHHSNWMWWNWRVNDQRLYILFSVKYYWDSRGTFAGWPGRGCFLHRLDAII